MEIEKVKGIKLKHDQPKILTRMNFSMQIKRKGSQKKKEKVKVKVRNIKFEFTI